MDFGWPNVEIGQKIANGQLLFLALHIEYNRTVPDFPVTCKPDFKLLAAKLQLRIIHANTTGIVNDILPSMNKL